MVTIVPYYSSGCYGVKIHLSNESVKEISSLTFYNTYGDELLRKKLVGNDHDINLSEFDLHILYVKIETSHNTVMKRILLKHADV
ncbi:MAG: hypothetical protein IPN73_17880 [Saprospiraceae bacterium]|nr:hypothetical protein [Saprospiraceae bacterium]